MYFVFRGLSTMGLKGRLSGDIGELAELRSLSVYFDESMMNTREERLIFLTRIGNFVLFQGPFV